MERYRLRIKVGEVEFEAEGSADVVQAQFNAFQRHLPAPISTNTHSATENTATDGSPASTQAADPPDSPAALPDSQAVPPDSPAPPSLDTALGAILKVDRRVVSLTRTPGSIREATLLVLYGQRVLMRNEAVTGAELVLGLRATGGVTVGRSERVFAALARQGDIVMRGRHRSKCYRLSNAGINAARQLAAVLLGLGGDVSPEP